MRVLTVHQPWAWAILHGGKDIENRPLNIAGQYRGPVAVHVALARPVDIPQIVANAVGEASRAGTKFPRVPARITDPDDALHHVAPWVGNRGAIIGVVDLVDVHQRNSIAAPPCCSSPWALDDHRFHLELANPRPLEEPIPATGRLGLTVLEATLEDRIREQVSL